VSACGLAPGQKYQVFIAIKSSDSKGIVLELVEINATCKSWRKVSITIKKSDSNLKTALLKTIDENKYLCLKEKCDHFLKYYLS